MNDEPDGIDSLDQRFDLTAFLPVDVDAAEDRVITGVLHTLRNAGAPASTSNATSGFNATSAILNHWSVPLMAAAAVVIAIGTGILVKRTNSTSQTNSAPQAGTASQYTPSDVVPTSAAALGVDPSVAAWADAQRAPSTAVLISELNYR